MIGFYQKAKPFDKMHLQNDILMQQKECHISLMPAHCVGTGTVTKYLTFSPLTCKWLMVETNVRLSMQKVQKNPVGLLAFDIDHLEKYKKCPVAQGRDEISTRRNISIHESRC